MIQSCIKIEIETSKTWYFTNVFTNYRTMHALSCRSIKAVSECTNGFQLG
jgi:hypothetical protein